jgi:hypothetical protein
VQLRGQAGEVAGGVGGGERGQGLVFGVGEAVVVRDQAGGGDVLQGVQAGLFGEQVLPVEVLGLGLDLAE